MKIHQNLTAWLDWRQTYVMGISSLLWTARTENDACLNERNIVLHENICILTSRSDFDSFFIHPQLTLANKACSIFVTVSNSRSEDITLLPYSTRREWYTIYVPHRHKIIYPYNTKINTSTFRPIRKRPSSEPCKPPHHTEVRTS